MGACRLLGRDGFRYWGGCGGCPIAAKAGCSAKYCEPSRPASSAAGKSTRIDRRGALNVFGKQPRFVWLEVDGVEVETPLERLEINDVIVVHTGETVPVDGDVVDGIAMVDQHTFWARRAQRVDAGARSPTLQGIVLNAGALR